MMISGYQTGSRWQGARMNAALVSAYVDPQARTALDIGSNEGVITCTLSLSGLDATGLELSEKSSRRAKALATTLGTSTRFENRAVTLDDLRNGPDFDVSALLSVHHQIAAEHGLEHADDFLRALARKTARQLFFQPACIHAKYARRMPFAQNDMAAAVSYFQTVVGSEMAHMQVIGFSQNDMPKSEPMRPLMLFSRTPIALQPGRDLDAVLNRLEVALSKTYLSSRIAFRAGRLFNMGRSKKAFDDSGG